VNPSCPVAPGELLCGKCATALGLRWPAHKVTWTDDVCSMCGAKTQVTAVESFGGAAQTAEV